MDYSLKKLGPKVYGAYLFSKLGLFKEKLVIFLKNDSDLKKKELLIKSGFKNKNNKIAIRFYKKEDVNPPFYFGTFSIQEIINYTNKHKGYISFVHKLIVPINTCQLYYNGDKIIISVFPGIRMPVQETSLKSEPVDFIEINNECIKIYRYTKKRNALNIEKKVYLANPNTMDSLKEFGKKIIKLKPKLNILLKEANPLVCDLNQNNENNINFMGLYYQLPFDFNLDFNLDCKVIKSKEDLFKYKGNKPIYLDFIIDINDSNYLKLITNLKKRHDVYLNCLTAHFAIILRELNVKIKHSNYINFKYFDVKEYKIKEKERL